MIVGIGTDLIEIERIKKACEKGLTYGAPTENELILADMRLGGRCPGSPAILR